MLTVLDRLLTTAQTCEMLGVSRMTLHRWRTAGRVPVVRLPNGTVRYRSTDIDAFIADRVDDDAVIIAAALTGIAERQAEEQRPLCPSCGKRRVNRGASMCMWCEQQRDQQLEHKRRWWDAHGVERKHERRAEQEAAAHG
jgi:excisionase family DNA binding protein